jgi:hypothetical protein
MSSYLFKYETKTRKLTVQLMLDYSDLSFSLELISALLVMWNNIDIYRRTF